MFMYTEKRLNDVFSSSPILPMDNNSRFVLMSDCHRGDGSWSDNFLKNQTIFFAALSDYYKKEFTYIELGDGDELWENRKMESIIQVHSDIFWLMSRFYEKNRLYVLYGNHDIVKKNQKYACKKFRSYFYDCEKKHLPLFPDITCYEGLILEDIYTKQQIFLTHGHQGDLLNDLLWPMTRFLVRYIWKPLELIGFLDPTNTAVNYKKQDNVERKLIHWVENKDQMLIAGHTHRPTFPSEGEPPYFNDGSCVHPRCITAIEICHGAIYLVKWSIKTREDKSLYVGRDVLAGPRMLNQISQR